jgi:hypothetical protein
LATCGSTVASLPVDPIGLGYWSAQRSGAFHAPLGFCEPPGWAGVADPPIDGCNPDMASLSPKSTAAYREPLGAVVGEYTADRSDSEPVPVGGR